MITPADIENKEFSRAKKGYNEEEVDDFLDLIILDMEKLIRENKQLKNELSKVHVQVDKHMSTETSVYETLEAAKSLMNDIAASAERRAEILLKNAELEASLITREAKESISRYTDEGNRLKDRVETLRERYKKMLESELERLEFGDSDFLADFEKDFMPASLTDTEEDTHVPASEPETHEAEDLTKTMVNVR
ncbi:MAG: DivIVA domain-containing protein [Anaerovoracaceae bacterium]|nr:DivIVA domain-containing protein [Anaerovoracaceae bacterium]